MLIIIIFLPFSLIYSQGPPTEGQRDLHVKSYIKATPRHSIPTRALSILHNYEVQSLPAPMRTYTRLITSLFSAHSSIAHAQAWDLFTHMRYVAHPTPDVLLYTLMIRACASSLTSRSEPERALDLWTEMTVDHKIQPTAGAYAAVILACARSGSKAYVSEAFRLAKQMLDAHRDAGGRSAFRPDGKTFSALLEGAKRVGDLARTRWILAEMVNRSDGENSGLDAEVNEEVMMHVFHAYAAYKPPFKRTTALLLDGHKDLPLPIAPEKSVSLVNSDPPESPPIEQTEPRFTHVPPQSRSEVVAEAEALFSRILGDTEVRSLHQIPVPFLPGERRFKHVQITPRLINSYLSVHYAHSSLEVSGPIFRTLFKDLSVKQNARSYVEVLERCGISRRGHERTAALALAEDAWNGWLDLENCEQGGEDGRGVNARMLERAHVAMIRVLTLYVFQYSYACLVIVESILIWTPISARAT